MLADTVNSYLPSSAYIDHPPLSISATRRTAKPWQSSRGFASAISPAAASAPRGGAVCNPKLGPVWCVRGTARGVGFVRSVFEPYSTVGATAVVGGGKERRDTGVLQKGRGGEEGDSVGSSSYLERLKDCGRFVARGEKVALLRPQRLHVPWARIRRPLRT